MSSEPSVLATVTPSQPAPAPRKTDADLAIAIRDVGKVYEIYDRPLDRLKQTLCRGRRQFYREFWALRDINLAVARGEAIGIIGRNGSGKSTLLQIIAGTLRPTQGEVTVRGRVHALLELGSGFNPEFTGRENVYLNGTVLGLSRREIDAKFDEIVQFAEIGDFLDQPIKTYSTGMVVRLAFAVQVQFEPDILIVDEALSVGDVQFQGKCFARIRQLLDDPSRAFLFVSHSTEAVKQICGRAVWLERGRIVRCGPSEEVCDEYMMQMRGYSRGTVVGGLPEPTQAAAAAAAAAEMAEIRQVCPLHGVQERWKTVDTGPLQPGRYHVTLHSRLSAGGTRVSVRQIEVQRHQLRHTLADSEVDASSGWQVTSADDIGPTWQTPRENEALQFEFSGHRLTLAALVHSGGGALEMVLEPRPMPARTLPAAASLYRPAAEFTARVAGLRFGSQQAYYTNVELLNAAGQPIETLPSGEELTVRLHMVAKVDLPVANFGCIVRDVGGNDLATINIFDEQILPPPWPAGTARVVDIRFRAALRSGIYTVATGISLSQPVHDPPDEVFDFCPGAASFQIVSERSGRPCWGLVRLPASIEVYP